MKWMKKNGTRVLLVNLVITVTILAVMLGNSLFLMNKVKQSSRDDGKTAVTAFANAFEDEYFRLNQLMTLCKDDPDFVLALAFEEEDEELSAYLRKAQEKISLIKASMTYARDVYAYKAMSDTIITIDQGIIKAQTFLEEYSIQGLSEKMLGNANILTALGEKLYFICPIQKYGSIVIDIDIRELMNTLTNQSLNNGAELAIYDKDGTVLLQSANFLKVPEEEKREQIGRKISAGENIYYEYTRHIHSIGYYCTLWNSVNIVEENLQWVNAICIGTLVLAFLFSGALLWFNQKTYRPVQKLIATFGSGEEEENEIEYITQRLTEFTKKEQQNFLLGDGKDDLNISLYYLLYNEINNRNLHLKISQIYKNTRLTLVAFQDSVGQPNRQLPGDLSKALGDVPYVNCDAYMMVFVLPEMISREYFLEKLKWVMSKGKEGKTFVVFGELLMGTVSMKKAFTQVVENLESTAIESSEQLTLSTMENRKNSIRYLKLDIQQQIVNCVIKSDLKLVTEIFELLLHGGSSLAEYRTICKMIASLLEYMVNTWDLEGATELVSSVNYDRMYHPGYMTEILLDSFYKISDAYQKGSSISLCNKIIEFLNENYEKPLSLDSISERFHITPAYLSSHFKKEVGENISVYLASLRIAKAKRLLEETDQKVSEISEQVGIYSQSTFIRLFKKNCGMTPNEYRRIKDTATQNNMES